MANHSRPATNLGTGRFATTDWRLIVAARGTDQPVARKALAELCEAYWYPIYSFIRARGYSGDQAQDLTQEFFARLLRPGFFDSVVPEKGRFRAFLLAACKHFLSNQRDHDRALKRGGGRLTIAIDPADAEGRFAREPWHDVTPEVLYVRRWAVTVLDRAMARLGEEMAREGKEALFDRLGPALLRDGSALPYAQVAAELGMTQDAVKMTALRLRRRYRDMVREEVVGTVDERIDVDAEIAAMFQAFRS
jgi:RNA polymerase sigma-70 factor (ECF subfamily)